MGHGKGVERGGHAKGVEQMGHVKGAEHNKAWCSTQHASPPGALLFTPTPLNLNPKPIRGSPLNPTLLTPQPNQGSQYPKAQAPCSARRTNFRPSTHACVAACAHSGRSHMHALPRARMHARCLVQNNEKIEAAKEKEKAAQRAAAALAAVEDHGGGSEAGKAGGRRGRGRIAAPAPSGPDSALSVDALPRDQGFTRPKVLLLLPQRNLAFKAVRRLVELGMRETRADSVTSKEKFVEQFGPPEAEEPEDDADERARARRAAKPGEWRALFSGNCDDHFRLGIKITRGAVRLFADLFQVVKGKRQGGRARKGADIFLLGPGSGVGSARGRVSVAAPSLLPSVVHNQSQNVDLAPCRPRARAAFLHNAGFSRRLWRPLSFHPPICPN
eukprot:366358-Chlamydomonas_euryale.AAC.2